jgi:hypothetical protein
MNRHFYMLSHRNPTGGQILQYEELIWGEQSSETLSNTAQSLMVLQCHVVEKPERKQKRLRKSVIWGCRYYDECRFVYISVAWQGIGSSFTLGNV